MLQEIVSIVLVEAVGQVTYIFCGKFVSGGYLLYSPQEGPCNPCQRKLSKQLPSLCQAVANGIQSQSFIFFWFFKGTYQGGPDVEDDISVRCWTVGSCCIGMLLNFMFLFAFIFI